MKNFYEYMEERDIEVPENEIPGSWFAEHRFPMVVQCTCCGMTMALPSAFISEDGYTFCDSCAEAVDENGGE